MNRLQTSIILDQDNEGDVSPTSKNACAHVVHTKSGLLNERKKVVGSKGRTKKLIDK